MVDINDDKLALAQKLGADLVINLAKKNPAKIIQERCGGVQAAVVTAVAKAAFNAAVDCLKQAAF